MQGLYFLPPAASYPQRRIEFHPRLWRVGQGWSAVWRATGHPVSSPGQRIPQTVHCSRALNCPGSWQKAIKDQPRADRILDQMLATSQEVDFWGRKDILLQTAEKTCYGFLSSSCFPRETPVGASSSQRSQGRLVIGRHRDHPVDAGPLGLVWPSGWFWFTPDPLRSMESEESETWKAYRRSKTAFL